MEVRLLLRKRGKWALLAALALALWAGDAPKRTTGEAWRLQYHFTPPQNWTNDPNGLVFYQGEYHLFYQYNPFGDRWGHMSWGHAVSSDLLHWHDLPVALPEENGIMIFSGSAVVDENNSSGLCKSNGSDHSCLVAIYTGHQPQLQTQNIAFSNDRGRTWTKYKGNPVIDLHLKDFRDPKVLWFEPERKWVMVTALSDQHKLRFFESHDLLHWSAMSDFGPEGGTGGVWECPDLFELPVEGAGEKRWVLVLNINPGGVAGGSGTQYFIGRFDGKAFRNENPKETELWMDYGKDYYAAVSFFGAPERVMLGWFSNWLYAGDTPEKGWRGAMALPRSVSLLRTPEGLRVRQQPVRQLDELRGPLLVQLSAPVTIDEANRELEQSAPSFLQGEVDVTFRPDHSGHFGLRVFAGKQNYTEVGVRPAAGEIYIDRSRSGITSFSKDFPGVQRAPFRAAETIHLRIFLDHSAVELLVDDGNVTLAERVYPQAGDGAVRLFAEGAAPKLISLKLWPLASVWQSSQPSASAKR